MSSSLSMSINSLNSVAMGEKKANLILTNCNLLSVYTREIIPNIQIAIIDDRIAFVGPDATHTIGPKTEVIDIKNKLLKIEDLELSFKMYEGISYVLKKINLDLNKGEKVALVGESGSGKSVTTKLILGLLNQKNVTKKETIKNEVKKEKNSL